MKYEKVLLIVVFLVLLAAVFLARLPSSVYSVLDWDESNYFVIAQDMLWGGVPYKTAFDFKGPILYFLFVPVIATFGNNVMALHLFTTFYFLFSIVFVFLVSRKMMDNQSYLVAPLVYGFFFSADLGGFVSNGELFMMLPVIVALYCVLIFQERSQRRFLFLAGICAALAVLIKQSAFFSLIPVACLVLYWNRGSLRSVRDSVLIFISGGGLILAAVSLYFFFNNAFYEFLDAFFLFGVRYVAATPFREGIDLAGSFFAKMFFSNPTTVLAAGSFLLCSLLFVRMSRRERKVFLFIVGLTVFSFLGVFSGRNMFPHYYLQLGLGFALLIGFCAWQTRIAPVVANMIVLLFLLFVSVTYFSGHVREYRLLKEQAEQRDPPRVVARYIADHTTPQETIFVLGGQPVIYFLAERRAPNKYFFWFLYYSKWRDILDLDRFVAEEFPKNKPVYFVYHAPDMKGDSALEVFMRQNYQIETVIGGYVIARLK